MYYAGKSKSLIFFNAGYISETLQLIRVLKDVLIPMKARGKRRSLITSKVGYITETLQPIIKEVYEVQLLMVL